MSGLPEVKISFVAGGVSEVLGAFKSVEQATERAQRSQTQKTEKGAQDRLASVRREERAKASEFDRYSRQREQAQERAFAKLERQADAWRREEIRAEQNKNRAIERDIQRSATARANFFKNVARDAVANMQSMASKATSIVGSVLAVGGGLTVAGAIQSQMRDEGMAKEISLNSQGAASKKDIIEAATAMGAQGFEREQALSALSAFIAKTGDVKMGIKVVRQLGDVANATGADLSELAKTAGIAFNTLSDAEKSNPEATMAAVRDAAAKGRVGAVDIKDLAGYGGRVFGTAAQFKGGLSRNSGELGALMQISAESGAAIDAAEATESAKKLALDVKINKAKLAKMGVTGVMDDAGQLNDVRTVFERLMVATGGDLSKLHKAGIDREGVRLFQKPAQVYSEARASALKQGKSEKIANQEGLEAINKIMEKYRNASMTKDQAEQQAKERLKETDKQLAIAMEDLRVEVGTKLVPEFVKLIPVIKQAIPYVGKLLDKMIELAQWAERNPLKAAFATASALILKSIGEAFAVNVLKQAVTASIQSMVAGTATTSVAAGAGSAVEGAGAAGVGGIAGIAGLALLYSSDNEKTKGAQDQAAFSEGVGEGAFARNSLARVQAARDAAFSQYQSNSSEDNKRKFETLNNLLLQGKSALVRRVSENSEAMQAGNPSVDPVKAEGFNMAISEMSKNSSISTDALTDAAKAIKSSAEEQRQAAESLKSYLESRGNTNGQPMSDGNN